MWDFIKQLDWATYWYMYIIMAFLAVMLGILVIKLLIGKLRQLLIFTLIILVITLLLYSGFLIGFVKFDILSVIGLSNVSISIQNGIEAVVNWFKNLFNIATVLIK